MDAYHIPALADRTLELLNINPSGVYADLTFGGGGHSRLILSRLGPEGRLFGFDQDADAQANAPEDERFTFVRGNFRYMRNYLRWLDVESVDGVLADLGVSFHHFDTPERGFSFRFDAPLDMRMNRQAKLSAADVVAQYGPEELTKILRDWGEVERPHKVAACIVAARERGGIASVGDLTAAVEACTPKKDANKFLSKLFQALRIEVNAEMDALSMMLEQSLRALKPGGRLAVISYHSLEDRAVKNFMRSGNVEGRVEKDFYGNPSTPWELVTRKAVAPDEEEVARNPRSRSARLRVAEKIAPVP